MTGRACSAEAATGAMTGATGATTGTMTAATGATTGAMTGATGTMTGKTAVAAGPGCSGNHELDDQAGHAAVWASGASCGAAPSILAAFWHRKQLDLGRLLRAAGDPETQTVSLVLDATTANIAMFAIAAHADEREAHVREVERSGHSLPEGSYGRRNREAIAARETRVAARLRAVEQAYRTATEHDTAPKFKEPTRTLRSPELQAGGEIDMEARAVTRETVAINAGRGGNDWHRRADLRLGPPLSARAVRSDTRGRR